MRAVQSIWFTKKKNSINWCCGWLNTRYHLFSCALSSVKLFTFFDKHDLVTDNIGAELLISRLNLSYSSHSTDLELVKDQKYLWVSNKLYTYSIQKEPFIHVDSDTYFFDKPESKLMNAPLLAQNFEYDHANYIQAYQDVTQYFEYIPDWIKKDERGRLTAVNAGIIGGTNVAFFHEFTTVVNDFLQRNEAYLSKCNYADLNVFVEQFLFTKYAQYKNIPIAYQTDQEFGPPCDYGMAKFTELPANCSYIHVTNYKQNPTVCEQLAQRLYIESPELYERVLTVCRQLEATHHPISYSLPEIHETFYRTNYLIGSLQFPNTVSLPLDQTNLEFVLDSFPEDRQRTVLQDVFSFEKCKKEFIYSLHKQITQIAYWNEFSQRVNRLFMLPYAQYSLHHIRQSERCIRIDSAWNWAEANEFTGQTADRNLLDNLLLEPSYFEVVLYIYHHQGLIREHLLDTLNILLFDSIEKPVQIAESIETVCQQVLQAQPGLDKQRLSAAVLERIRHFLYQGVLEVVNA